MKRGFTLIELLVVITILAVLAGAAMPYVQSYVEEARLAKAKTDLEEIARALMVYETREGEYTSGDVSILTGRYLNKAPIDPWGKAYAVSTSAGYVFSGGPDRDLGLINTDKANDNIMYSYQPPLALVSVKWVDKNNSGAVDSQNVNDELHLLFSRKLATSDNLIKLMTSSDTLAEAVLASCFAITSQYGSDKIAKIIQVKEASNDVRVIASRTIVLKVSKYASSEPFAVGSDTVSVLDNHKTLYDLAKDKNACISNQPVVILPQ
ncbi:MAG: Type II secretion system protein G precursor [bacterium ADurb.Bin374]|nr:MAG: Type II secretion system protein G precursor [bacterium ADurb.Bin374]